MDPFLIVAVSQQHQLQIHRKESASSSPVSGKKKKEPLHNMKLPYTLHKGSSSGPTTLLNYSAAPSLVRDPETKAKNGLTLLLI